MHGKRIAIVGGGIMGLGIAWRCAQAGYEVDLFDAGEPGRGASWAAAGILAGHLQGSRGALSQLQLASLERWPSFAAELERASGQTIGYRREGNLIPAFDADAAQQLASVARSSNRLRWLARDDALALEPKLAGGCRGALLSPHDHAVDNRLVCTALVKAATGAGVHVHARRAVTGVIIEGGCARGVEVDQAPHEADAVVLAAGAWSAAIAGLPAAARPAVQPLKGEMVALAMTPDAPELRHVVWGAHVYMVPRDGGRLVIGATHADTGFATDVTAAGVHELLSDAIRTVPALGDLPIEETWAGLRPIASRGMPYLGESPLSGFYWCTGHGANGILMAAESIERVSALLQQDLVTGVEPSSI